MRFEAAGYKGRKIAGNRGLKRIHKVQKEHPVHHQVSHCGAQGASQ
jgi:hypothetical protein